MKYFLSKLLTFQERPGVLLHTGVEYCRLDANGNVIGVANCGKTKSANAPLCFVIVIPSRQTSDAVIANSKQVFQDRLV